jgi:phage terminase large subunit-like protein
MTALVVAVPLDDGRVAIRGHYWWPKADVAQRELDYRMPVRTWALEGKMTLTPGREIDYEAVRTTLLAVREEFDVRSVGYDAWGSKYLAEQLQADGVPLLLYRMGIATFGPWLQPVPEPLGGLAPRGRRRSRPSPRLRRGAREA